MFSHVYLLCAWGSLALLIIFRLLKKMKDVVFLSLVVSLEGKKSSVELESFFFFYSFYLDSCICSSVGA
jgi:hypothetical protein